MNYDEILGIKKKPEQQNPGAPNQEQMQQMQQKMLEVQKRLEALEIEGSAGAGELSVKVTLDGRHLAKKVYITPEAMKESPEVLGDLVASAINDACQKVEVAIQKEMFSVMHGGG